MALTTPTGALVNHTHRNNHTCAGTWLTLQAPHYTAGMVKMSDNAVLFCLALQYYTRLNYEQLSLFLLPHCKLIGTNQAGPEEGASYFVHMPR